MTMNAQLQTIGFDAKRAAQNRTGLGNYSRFVIRGLCRYAPHLCLHLYTPNPQKVHALDGLDDEPTVAMHFPKTLWWKRFRNSWRVWGMTRDIQKDKVQLYHGLSNELPLNIHRAKGVKTIVTIHDLIFLRYPQYYKPVSRWIYRYKFRRACRLADHIIAVSECTKRDIIHFFGTPAEKISVIYQGCDEQFRQPVSEAKREEVRERYQLPERYILYVGSIEERKNLLLLAKALSLLENSSVHVIAVGKHTPYADRVQTFISAHDLNARFHIISGVSFSDLPALYQQAVVFVYPSRFEGFGIPLLEALCSGTPAIGCTGSCLEEAGGPSSLYVDPDDPQAMAQAIAKVLADERLCAKMITDGYAHAAHFEAAALTQQLVALYEHVAGDEKRGR